MDARPATNVVEGLGDVESARLSPMGSWSTALTLDQAFDPLILDDHDGVSAPYVPQSRGVITNRTTLRMLAAYSPLEWLELGLGIPMVAHQDGDAQVGLQSPQALDGAGFGDLRLTAKLKLLETEGTTSWGALGFSVLLDGALPTGDADRLQGGGGSFAPRLIVGYRTPIALRLVANVGYTFRDDHAVLNVRYRSEPTWAFGIEVPVLEVVEIYATVRGDQAIEGALGGRFVPHPRVVFATRLSVGLADDPYTSDLRLGFTVAYRHPSARSADADGDGIPDHLDRCLADREDADGFEDEDGCPDPDDDGDGLNDEVDQCVREPEDADGFEDEDGCPDFDNDGDGITDRFDRCADDAEDHDGFEDGDGCPDPDNDDDGIPDRDDRCPRDAEDIDGDADDDGCPDHTAALSIDVMVYFAPGSAQIPPEYRYPLSRVARTIIALPDHLHVWIEGYADDHGQPSANMALSRRRARAVYELLVARGVPRDQMDVQPYGERAPAVPNESEVDRHVNRRVEFRVGPRSLRDSAPDPDPQPSRSTP